MKRNFYYPRSGDEMKKEEIEVFHAKIDFFKGSQESEEPGEYALVVQGVTALCPRSGYPDFANFVIGYRSKKKIDEKSFWNYIQRYRYTYISHEAITGEICKFVKELTDAESVSVYGYFRPRGNLETKVVCHYGEEHIHESVISEDEKLGEMIVKQFIHNEIEKTAKELSEKFEKYQEKKEHENLMGSLKQAASNTLEKMEDESQEKHKTSKKEEKQKNKNNGTKETKKSSKKK